MAIYDVIERYLPCLTRLLKAKVSNPLIIKEKPAPFGKASFKILLFLKQFVSFSKIFSNFSALISKILHALAFQPNLSKEALC